MNITEKISAAFKSSLYRVSVPSVFFAAGAYAGEHNLTPVMRSALAVLSFLGLLSIIVVLQSIDSRSTKTSSHE
jgi:hypothetical protein